MKKRVLIFSLSYYPLFTSGAEAAVKEITDRIDPSDIEFHMVTLRFDSYAPREEKIGNVFVHRIGLTRPKPSFAELGKWPLDLNKPLFQFLATWKACQLHRQTPYDAIWALMAHSSGVPAALFTLFHPGTPYILTLQEGDPIEHIERVMRPLWPLFTRAFTRANIIQSISSFLADWARRRHFKGPIEIIHNGANPKDLHGEISEDEVEKIKQLIQKKAGEVILMNTARLVHQKGHDTVIRSLPLLPSNIRLVLVGDGPDEVMLKRLAQDLQVANRVTFMGRVDRSEVTAYRKNADIFVGPSRSEGLGNAFLSAMASRLPVIATREGGLAEFLTEKTGWIVEKNQPEQVAERVKYIISHPDEVRRVTETARQMVLSSYDWDLIAKEMRQRVFERVWR